MPRSAGTRLGSYEIIGPLGAGGMGEVYRARDLRLRRDVAIKVLPTDVSSSPERLARFEREARTVAGLNHPNIVTLHSVEDENAVRFLTMELVEGQTLATRVTAGGLPIRDLLELAIPLTDALVAAHEKGVIHRDLKPGNVMVTREGRVKVLDFGLAKMMDADRSSDRGASLEATADLPLSVDGQVVGTMPYMAPEQLRGEVVDVRSDLFSLGIILYELAAGRRPFDGASNMELGSSILRDTPEPLTLLRSDLPGEFERIVSSCLEKKRSERVQTALEVNQELRGLRSAMERGEPAAKPASDQVASIAVLPFVNRSASADDEYFSDGLADELLQVLGRIQGLRVSARTSSFHFKGKDTTIAEIGRALNVATILEGSVRKAGNRIRVSVQLVKTSDGFHIWSNTYDRTLEDIFAVQDDIAQSVVSELRAALLGERAPGGQAEEEVAKAAMGRTTNPEAHRLRLLARHIFERGDREDEAKGIEVLERVVSMDPKDALAWAELNRVYLIFAGQWGSLKEHGPLAREAAERAVALAPDLAEGHVARARTYLVCNRDHRGAEASLARARELAPDNVEVLRMSGRIAGHMGRFEEAIVMTHRAHELDPMSATILFNLASFHGSAGHYVEAEACFREVLEIAPQYTFAYSSLSLALVGQGRNQEALQVASMEATEDLRLYALAIVHHALGDRVESDRALRQLVSEFAEDCAIQIAEVHGARGDVDAAFEWLERAYAQGDPGLLQLRVSRPLHSLHGDPRWGPWLRRVGLES